MNTEVKEKIEYNIYINESGDEGINKLLKIADMIEGINKKEN